MKQHLWLIHGNLQQPTVWDALTIDLKDDFVIHKENLWETKQTDFWSWATAFCNDVSNYSSEDKHHLIGYSLGGRLGMHALLHKPELWQSAMTIASDTGLSNTAAREKQLAWDRTWGKRFLTENWESLLTEWNQLGVFQGFENPNSPQERDFSREAIAACFENFSKGNQDDLLPMLKGLKTPNILYVTGSVDTKYRNKGKALASACEVIEHRIIENTAHRVPWENSKAFKELLHEHLQEYSD